MPWGLRVCVALLPAALAPACGPGTAAAPPSAPAGTLVDEPCDIPARGPTRCAWLFVHENRRAPGGRVIPLRIVVLRATGPDPAADPVFLLAGGPGQAASELIGWRAAASEELRATRDLVFLDQRGTGGSNPLTCAFYGPPGDPQSYFGQFLPPARVRACRAHLERTADLSQYTTANAVDDLDEVRAALGYERINLIGVSYGTRLALEYLRQHEPRVRSLVLDGAVRASARMPENFGAYAQRALDALLDECAADRQCASAFPDIREKARTVFARLADAPARATVAHPRGGQPAEVRLTREHVAEAVRYMTYTSRDAARVPLYLDRAANGDFSPIAEFLMRWRASGTFDGLYLSVTCAEDVPFLSRDAERRDGPTYLGGYRVREQRAACAEWPSRPMAEPARADLASAVPALILSGALDPVTPPEEAAAVARSLRSSLHVTIPFAGHSPAGLRGIECLDALRRAFLDQGSVEKLNTSCIATISRPGFATR